MSLSERQIAGLFSAGRFEDVMDYFDKDVVWTIPGQGTFHGAEEVTANCRRTGEYFSTVETDFRTENIIEDGNRIAVCGTAEFRNSRSRIALVHACDVFEFSNEGKLIKITSYCVNEQIP